MSTFRELERLHRPGFTQLPVQADFVDQQKLRVAGLKTRLSKLAQDRRRMEQEFSQALAAKQAELARLSG